MHRRLRATASALALLLLVASCSSDDDSGAGGRSNDQTPERQSTTPDLTLEVVSTRPEYVSGGDVLVAIPDAYPDTQLSVDGENVDATWRTNSGKTEGLITGLTPGEHEIVATSGDATASVTITDHPITGPLFAGPHLPLEACSTETYGLGEPVDDDCSAAEPVITWSYVTTDGERKPLADPTNVPADADTFAGTTEPFVLREERGTIDRAVYWITIPDTDPDPEHPETWSITSPWNRRLVYEYGGGCGVTYAQGFKLLGPPDLTLLQQGYAHATATFNTFQVTCNPTLSAETTMMVKEHFIEAYATPDLTIGTGGSGGAIQQYEIVQNYPGLLDAAAPLLPFPDAISIATDVLDCALLDHFDKDGAGKDWSGEQQLAVNGHLSPGTCTFWTQTFAPNVNPTTGCTLDLLEAASGAIDGLDEGVPPGVDDSLAYDAETNPDGLRCTLQDGNVNQVGRDPDTGFARRPWDNVGVQYGLAALNDGAIDVDHFLDLNEGIGSFDIDGNWVEDRAAADEATISTAYETGAVNEGAGDLRRVPIIEVNLWTDDQGDIHTRDRAFTARERVRLPDGSLPSNLMLWTRGLPEGEDLVDSLTGSVNLGAEVIGLLDEWATAMKEQVPDRDAASDDQLQAALEQTRPDDAIDNCVTTDGERVAALDLYDNPGPCTDPYPISSTPRRVAGTPLIHDILKCELQSVDDAVAGDVYQVDFTDEQRTRLETIFPEGVCDWTQPGVGQVPVGDPWQDYSDAD